MICHLDFYRLQLNTNLKFLGPFTGFETNYITVRPVHVGECILVSNFRIILYSKSGLRSTLQGNLFPREMNTNSNEECDVYIVFSHGRYNSCSPTRPLFVRYIVSESYTFNCCGQKSSQDNFANNKIVNLIKVKMILRK